MKELSLPDGRKFAWRTYGSGPPLILIHGWGSSSAIFTELMTQLPGYHCLAPDLPGYGASSAAAAVDLETLTDDFIAWFAALGLEKIVLLGWSLGGILAQHLAARFPQQVERLLLVATTPCFVSTHDWPHGLSETAVRALGRDFKRAPALTLDNFRRLQFQGEGSVPPALIPEVEMTTALGGLDLLRHVDLRDDLPKITLPALILHGSDDVIIPRDAGRYLATTLPHGLFHEISGCGHAPFLSARAEVSAAIRDFLP